MQPTKPKHKGLLVDQDNIRKLLTKRGVMVFLDTDSESQESKMGATYIYSSKTKILTIVATNFKKEDRQFLLEIIKKTFNLGGLILKKSKEQVLESYTEYYNEKNIANEQVLNFFKDIIPFLDFEALRMALFIRYQKERGENVSTLKSDIRNRFGDRGANIANLCSAGYFESEFMPLYNLLDRNDFDEYYEIAVGKKARALFVHAGMRKEEMEKEFQIMLSKALSYHLGDFRIHGLGKHNVSTIKEFFTEKMAEANNTDSNVNYILKKEYERTAPFYVIEYTISIIYREEIKDDTKKEN